MKIRFMSDLHLEYNDLDFINQKNFFDYDVLVLAGDIITYKNIQSREKLLSFIYSTSKPILYVCGNHEFYNLNIQQVLLSLKKIKEINPHFYVLNNDFVDIDGVRFLGTTLWSDFSYVKNTNQLFYIIQKINDFKNIKIKTYNDFLSYHNVIRFSEKAKNFIRHNTNIHQPNVVITHFGPSIKSIDTTYTSRDLALYYVSNCEPIIYEHPEITVWIHGHIHRTFDYFIHFTRVVSNPRGRPRYDKNLNLIGYDNNKFDPFLYIQL